jgi:hypothetical protein
MRLFCVGGLKVAETLLFRRSNVDGMATFLPFEGDEAGLQTPCCNFVAVSLLNWHHFGDVIDCENHRVVPTFSSTTTPHSKLTIMNTPVLTMEQFSWMHAPSTLTKTDPLLLNEIDPPVGARQCSTKSAASMHAKWLEDGTYPRPDSLCDTSVKRYHVRPGLDLVEVIRP